MTNSTNTYSYWESTLTGSVYAMPANWIPQYDGWESVHEETYLEHAKSKGLLKARPKMTVKTKDEYAAFGFTEKEIPFIRRHDILLNQYISNGYLKPRKEAEMYEIAKRLGL